MLVRNQDMTRPIYIVLLRWQKALITQMLNLRRGGIRNSFLHMFYRELVTALETWFLPSHPNLTAAPFVLPPSNLRLHVELSFVTPVSQRPTIVSSLYCLEWTDPSTGLLCHSSTGRPLLPPRKPLAPLLLQLDPVFKPITRAQFLWTSVTRTLHVLLFLDTLDVERLPTVGLSDVSISFWESGTACLSPVVNDRAFPCSQYRVLRLERTECPTPPGSLLSLDLRLHCQCPVQFRDLQHLFHFFLSTRVPPTGFPNLQEASRLHNGHFVDGNDSSSATMSSHIFLFKLLHLHVV